MREKYTFHLSHHQRNVSYASVARYICGKSTKLLKTFKVWFSPSASVGNLQQSFRSSLLGQTEYLFPSSKRQYNLQWFWELHKESVRRKVTQPTICLPYINEQFSQIAKEKMKLSLAAILVLELVSGGCHFITYSTTKIWNLSLYIFVSLSIFSRLKCYILMLDQVFSSCVKER